MSDTENLIILAMIGVGAFLLGKHYGMKQAAARDTGSAAAASQEDAGMLWFAQYGRM